ncbi:hypothetical protein AWENTII_011661 [Aspergillus wentii]|nr:hypothetical protein MW887_006120 [Aspergillus wentii]
MADEPRRSGRSTKGQHKNLDMVTETPAKKSKSKGQLKEKTSKPSAEPTPAPSEEEEEIIRCICGEYEEEEDVERDMICCDQCSAWQHNDCMGLTFAKGEEPDQYFCEQCKPENHKVLLDKIARGEKPWEEAAEKRRKEAEEKKSRRRKGKRGGKKGRPSESRPSEPRPSESRPSESRPSEPRPSEPRPSEPKTEASTPAPTAPTAPSATPVSAGRTSIPPAPPSATPVREEKNGDVGDARPASTQKRKFDEHQETTPSEETGPKLKQQRVSPPAKEVTPIEAKEPQVKAGSQAPASRQGSVAETVTATAEELWKPEDISNPARRSAATALVKLFVDQISEAQKRGSFSLPKGKPAEDFARQLGISIENAMYQSICGGSGEPTEPYKLQLRTILFNVKKNVSLRDRLLVGSLLPDALSKMSSQDMASEELQQKDAEIKREAERQHIIVQEQGPRIRRTHKGEELVEDEAHTVASEPVFSAAPARRSIADADGSPTATSPTSPGTKQQSESRESRKPAKPQTIDTKMTDAADHDQRFPSIHSPGGADHDQVFPEVSTHIREPLPTGKVQADAEIDHLLRDDEEPDSPPYSPKEYQEEGAVWRGKVSMNTIAEFSSSAKHVGGADLSGRIPWSQLAPSTLLVDGRIDIQLASNYLCGLRFSLTTDVSVISIARPEVSTERTSFDKLFNYFQERKRYGVVGKHPFPAVKDTYIIPIEAGSTKKPEFIELLENNALEDPTPERVLLVVFVVKTGDSNTPSVQPPSHHPSQEPPASASPLTVAAGTPQAQFFTPGPRSASQPFVGTPATPIPYNQQPLQHPKPQSAPQFQQGSAQAAATGMAAAISIFGPQINAPAVQQLLQQAPNIDPTQLLIVRDILQRRPDTASSYEKMTEALLQAQATTNGHGQ